MDARPFILGVAAAIILVALLLLTVVVRRVMRPGRSNHPVAGTRLLDAYVVSEDPLPAQPRVERDERISATLAPQSTPEAAVSKPLVDLAKEPLTAEVSPPLSATDSPERPLADSPGTLLAEEADAEPAFKLVAPVELWFGESRVGVRPGTPTFAEFQRLAGLLLGELKQAHHQA